MSRETLLDDAITKAKEAEEWQLAEWLRMARGAESAARWYSDKLREAHRTERKLLDENAKLREELAQWERLTAGIELPEYPITQFQPKDSERENTRLREENAKLREFASEAFSMAFNFYHGAGTAEDLRELKVEFRELGIEVDG